MALRIEGALWAKPENHFYWNSTAPLDEPDDWIAEIARVPRSVARSFGRHSRRSQGEAMRRGYLRFKKWALLKMIYALAVVLQFLKRQVPGGEAGAYQRAIGRRFCRALRAPNTTRT